MKEIFTLLIGIGILILGVPIGNLLARFTKEELKDSAKYINWIVWISLIIGFIGLIIGNDVLMFSLFFIAIVGSRSLLCCKKRHK
jgi:hypothetical protein